MSSSHILVIIILTIIIIINNLIDELMIYWKGEWSASVVLSAGLVMLLKDDKEADCNTSGVLSPCRGLIGITNSQKNNMGIYINTISFSICTHFAL